MTGSIFVLIRLLIKQEEKKEKVKCAMRIADIKETRIIDIARIRTTRACLVQQLLEAGEVEAKHRLMVSKDYSLKLYYTCWCLCSCYSSVSQCGGV